MSHLKAFYHCAISLTKAMKLSVEEVTKHCGKIRRPEINKETCSWIRRLAVLQTPPEQFAIQLRFTDQKTEHPGHASTTNLQIQLKFYPDLNEVLLWMEFDKLILKFTKKINKQIILENRTQGSGVEKTQCTGWRDLVVLRRNSNYRTQSPARDPRTYGEDR